MSLLVVTPTLGRSPWLDATVASVSTHAPDTLHVLACPPQQVAQLRTRFPRLIITAEPSPAQGMYAAINAGAAAVSDWTAITYLNDDDQFEAGFSSRVTGPGPRTDIVYGDVHYVDEHGRNLGRMPIARPAWVATLLSDGAAPFTQQGTIISRATWTQLGGFAEHRRLAADYDFWCRAAAAGFSFGRIPRIVASFRLHGRQLSASQTAMRTELLTIRAQHAAALARHRRFGARLLFRCCSMARLWERRRRAGVWSSAALYARYSAPA